MGMPVQAWSTHGAHTMHSALHKGLLQVGRKQEGAWPHSLCCHLRSNLGQG